MEYPIIDTLTNAYIRNGWTGLKVEHGKNLYNPVNNINGYTLASDGYPTQINERRFSTKYPIEVTGDSITISYEAESGYNVYLIYSLFFDDELIIRQAGYDSGTTINIASGNKIYLSFYDINTSIIGKVYNIQVEYGNVQTEYEPAHDITDIFSRTRLPIIRHYPYALIDALQRAAAGTQTADDTEILRHYLTPLGIGGI